MRLKESHRGKRKRVLGGGTKSASRHGHASYLEWRGEKHRGVSNRLGKTGNPNQEASTQERKSFEPRPVVWGPGVFLRAWENVSGNKSQGMLKVGTTMAQKAKTSYTFDGGRASGNWDTGPYNERWQMTTKTKSA